jgi:hypothetical protein
VASATGLFALEITIMSHFHEVGAALIALADLGVDPIALAPASDLAAAISTRLALTPDSPLTDIVALVELSEALEAALDRLALAVYPPTHINTVADAA